MCFIMHVKIKDNKFFQLRWRVLERCAVLNGVMEGGGEGGERNGDV